jgi:hypothetical protein
MAPFVNQSTAIGRFRPNASARLKTTTRVRDDLVSFRSARREDTRSSPTGDTFKDRCRSGREPFAAAPIAARRHRDDTSAVTNAEDRFSGLLILPELFGGLEGNASATDSRSCRIDVWLSMTRQNRQGIALAVRHWRKGRDSNPREV